MKNRYGVDVPYFKKELKALLRSLDNRTPEELQRYLLTLSKVVNLPKSQGENQTTPNKQRNATAEKEIEIHITGVSKELFESFVEMMHKILSLK